MKNFFSYIYIVILFSVFISYQNCTQVNFSKSKEKNIIQDYNTLDNNNDDDDNLITIEPPPLEIPPIDECPITDPHCVPPPLVKEPGVVTILLAMGDMDNLLEMDVDQYSAQKISEKMIQYASSVVNPKVLLVLDRNHHGESPIDFENLWKNLLFRYNPTHIDEPIDGLKIEDVIGYDVIWFVNPGYPMGKKQTHDTLLNFSGGVVLSGDDMTASSGLIFDMSDLTGLKYIDNGVTIKCGENIYKIDNNLSPYRYIVNLESSFFPDLELEHLSFEYGNDIDNSILILNPGVEVLATAVGSPSDCNERRPVIVRHPKPNISILQIDL